MKVCFKCKTSKNFSEFYSDKQKSDGLSSSCIFCVKENRKTEKSSNRIKSYGKKYYEEHREKIKERSKKVRQDGTYHKEWKEKNPDYHVSYGKKYRKDNFEKLKEYNQNYQKENKEIYRKSVKKWRKKNSGRVNFWNNNRRVKKLRQTPLWLNEEEKKKMEEIYSKRPDGFHVDHIIPLQGKEVRGLHVPWNLQYLTIEENCKKHNKLEEKYL